VNTSRSILYIRKTNGQYSSKIKKSNKENIPGAGDESRLEPLVVVVVAEVVLWCRPRCLFVSKQGYLSTNLKYGCTKGWCGEIVGQVGKQRWAPLGFKLRNRGSLSSQSCDFDAKNLKGANLFFPHTTTIPTYHRLIYTSIQLCSFGSYHQWFTTFIDSDCHG
jgi:hypothetical protein